MKTKLVILIIFIMASINSFGQTELKNGVYEFFTTIDSVDEITEFEGMQVSSSKSEETTKIDRILIVKNDAVLYQIENIKESENIPAYFSGIRDDYYLQLEKKSDNFYKSENENIGLNITVETGKNITVEVVKGAITGFFSGGAYMTRTEVLPPEKQTLTFVRELTAKDEEKLSQAKEKIMNIPENTLSVIKYEGFRRGKIYLTEIHRVPVETKMYPKDSWYGKAQEHGTGDFLYFSFIEGKYPDYYFRQSGFLHVIPVETAHAPSLQLELWLDSYHIFSNKELYGESKLNRQWNKIEGVDGDMWRKIVRYYMENVHNTDTM